MADELLSAVACIKLADPTLTAAQVHAALDGTTATLAEVKRACSKAAKAAAVAAAVPRTLVPPPAGSVVFMSCQSCGKQISDPRVCSGCVCVCYCSPACQTRDTAHTPAECSRYAQHMARDVRVHLPGSSAWLAAAMDHRCEMSMCALLGQMKCHEGAFRLLCGCAGPSAPHRALVDQMEGSAPPEGATLPASWSDYYAARGLPTESPVALLSTWALTVAHVLATLGLAGAGRPLVVHYLGPEKEVMLLPTFAELAALLPAATLAVEMIGPLGIPLPDAPSTFEGARGGRVTVTVRRGLYHDVAPELPPPDVAIALNAGLAVTGYAERWPDTLRCLAARRTPFVFSDYSEQSVEKGLAFARQKASLAPSLGVRLNPFRAPMRLPRVDGGCVGFPTLSNGFLAACNTEALSPGALKT